MDAPNDGGYEGTLYKQAQLSMVFNYSIRDDANMINDIGYIVGDHDYILTDMGKDNASMSIEISRETFGGRWSTYRAMEHILPHRCKESIDLIALHACDIFDRKSHGR